MTKAIISRTTDSDNTDVLASWADLCPCATLRGTLRGAMEFDVGAQRCKRSREAAWAKQRHRARRFNTRMADRSEDFLRRLEADTP